MHFPTPSMRTRSVVAGAGLALAVLGPFACARADALDKAVPAPLLDERKGPATESIVLAGGCFWGMQAVFEHVNGVTKVVAGYAGGARGTATYDQVTTETTGHAESISVTFSPRQVSLGTLLRVFFSVAHDPTELNRQGPDEGSSYRSEIFVSGTEQEHVARAYVAQLGKSGVFPVPLVTRVEALKGFYPAETYHQDFLIKNPDYPYIVVNDLPKLAALARVFPNLYRKVPARLAAL